MQQINLCYIVAQIYFFINLLYYDSPGRNGNHPYVNQDKNIFSQRNNRAYIVTERFIVHVPGLIIVDTFLIKFWMRRKYNHPVTPKY